MNGLMEWILKSSGIRILIDANESLDSQTKDIKRTDERPATSRVARPRTSNQERKSYQKYIQIITEMESQGLLEQFDVRIIKALILRENLDVMREFDHYFLHDISLHELGNRLRKLADKLNLYMERPSSPIPKNKQFQYLVDSFAKEYLIEPEDLSILRLLISEENEFVFSAFDVYESDRDQAELLDSIMRAINKHKKNKNDSIRSSPFYPNFPHIEVAPHEISQEIIVKIINDLGISKN